MTDYSITWGYIVEQMETRFGIAPGSEEKFSMGEIKRNIGLIWADFFYKLLKSDEEFKDLITE